MIRWWISVAVFLFACNPAQAIDSPYFGAPVCEQDVWTLRFLFGDGIFGADPAAAVVLDKTGRILAYHVLGASPFAILGKPCRVTSLDLGDLLAPDPDKFELGPVLFGDRAATKDARWEHEPNYGTRALPSYGFAAVETTALFRALSDVWSARRGILLFLILGATSIGFAATWGRCKAWYTFIPVALASGVISVLFWGLLYMAVLFGDMSLLVGTGVGALWLVALVALVRRRWRNKQRGQDATT